jgi:hypothetical protein
MTTTEPGLDPNAAAQWMADQVETRGFLYQDDAVSHIARHFGKDLTYENANGNPAIGKPVLAAFKQLTDGKVVWERGVRQWRRKRSDDPAGRQVD